MNGKSENALILVVADGKEHADILTSLLAKQGYQTRVGLNARTAVQLAMKDPVPDLVVFDLKLSDNVGLEVCREIRRNLKIRNMLILTLTERPEGRDCVPIFEAGCDDCVEAPCNPQELILRIQAVLHRGAIKEQINCCGSPVFER
ncbi:MAG: hypothetical protein A2X86_22375 [Bdellovibrionales bacterium GWA2_49_15]|nr:MAG: hypothetical protein A2X86_22375 [Bdellovibrionales bacterium GWA2_49_15]HAZ14774.1 hypothetical protein [Bdellovibrionales bacterium]